MYLLSIESYMLVKISMKQSFPSLLSPSQSKPSNTPPLCTNHTHKSTHTHTHMYVHMHIHTCIHLHCIQILICIKQQHITHNHTHTHLHNITHAHRAGSQGHKHHTTHNFTILTASPFGMMKFASTFQPPYRFKTPHNGWSVGSPSNTTPTSLPLW